MLVSVGILGSVMTILSCACVIFMPVSDATTLMFTAPLFTMIFSALIMKECLTFLKVVIGNRRYHESMDLNMKSFND